MKYILILLLLVGCETEIFNRNPLSQQLLRVRLDYPEKLTNSMCKKYKGDECKELEILQYDMNDKAFREKLLSFNFICNIAGKRFRICREQAAFCRWELKCKRKGFLGFGCKEYHETVVLVKSHQYLVDAKTTCRRKDL